MRISPLPDIPGHTIWPPFVSLSVISADTCMVSHMVRRLCPSARASGHGVSRAAPSLASKHVRTATAHRLLHSTHASSHGSGVRRLSAGAMLSCVRACTGARLQDLLQVPAHAIVPTRRPGSSANRSGSQPSLTGRLPQDVVHQSLEGVTPHGVCFCAGCIRGRVCAASRPARAFAP